MCARGCGVLMRPPPLSIPSGVSAPPPPHEVPSAPPPPHEVPSATATHMCVRGCDDCHRGALFRGKCAHPYRTVLLWPSKGYEGEQRP
ncbi:hypothetical protein GUJ93_ZPchr0003g16640 [Zizania palustris]|uniref:Uncharacterized protein n=1 Tax=Zizania palustris TaxID=103762 RepID=A0A8J5S8R3_ZIZPA|nr:hypothetical protein GUJ93_ZPchr0003g16640 [Zizania palustris]